MQKKQNAAQPKLKIQKKKKASCKKFGVSFLDVTVTNFFQQQIFKYNKLNITLHKLNFIFVGGYYGQDKKIDYCNYHCCIDWIICNDCQCRIFR